MTLRDKLELHRRFWAGEGPSLILIPADRGELYDVADYQRRFEDPRLMWESEMRRASRLVDWPTDGIPTVHFTSAGARTSEDTATLLSPEMIEEFVLPYTERALLPFGGGFVHFCGYHPPLFERLCRSPAVRAVGLGNSEAYDPRWLLERCAETGTVLYSRIAARPGEDWRGYTRRLGSLVAETGARCILRPLVHPDTREECAAMLDSWHELTARAA